MARIFLLIGVLAMGGAAFVANDTAKMSVNDPDYVFDAQEYAGKLPGRLRTAWTEDWGPRLAGLPGAAKEMATNWSSEEAPEGVEQTNRLGNFKERNSVLAREGMDAEDIAKMSPMELYKNREKVMKGMTTKINKQMDGIFN